MGRAALGMARWGLLGIALLGAALDAGVLRSRE
jgi:hypothetical protein